MNAERSDEHHADDTRRYADDDDEHHALPPNFKPHESPWTMTVPLDRSRVLVDCWRTGRNSLCT